MIQNIIVILLFVLALGFLVKKYFFKPDSAPGCAKGCDNCAEAQQNKILD